MILVYTAGFSDMPDLVMWPDNFLDIALWVKHPRWLPFHVSLNLTDVTFSVITTRI